MSQTVRQVQPGDPQAGNATAPKPKRKRSPSMPTPAFFVIQVLGEDGKPMEFNKKRIRLVAVERDFNKVFELIEGETHENAIYLRGIVPPWRAQAPKPAA